MPIYLLRILCKLSKLRTIIGAKLFLGWFTREVIGPQRFKKNTLQNQSKHRFIATKLPKATAMPTDLDFERCYFFFLSCPTRPPLAGLQLKYLLANNMNVVQYLSN